MSADSAVARAEVPTDERLNLFDDAVLRDSLPEFTRLREWAPVVRLPRSDLWAVTRYAPIREVLRDPERFSSEGGVAFNEEAARLMAGTTISTDPPDHQRLRAALMENLTPRALRGLQSGMDATAERHLTGLLDGSASGHPGGFDGFRELARPFVVSMVVDLIGIRGEQRDLLLTWGEAALNLQGPRNARAEEGFGVAGGLRTEDLAEGSLGRGIFEAADRGELSPEHRPLLLEQLVVAGMDTTITAIGNALILLGRHPEQFALLRSRPELVSSAAAEVLRYLPPLPVIGRRVTGDTEIAGTRVPAGAQLALLLWAGNRDPRQYADPNAFDIARNPVDHLAFGHGIHGCAGQALARMEIQAVLKAVLGQLESFGVGEVEHRLNNITRPHAAIPVTDLVMQEPRPPEAGTGVPVRGGTVPDQ